MNDFYHAGKKCFPIKMKKSSRSLSEVVYVSAHNCKNVKMLCKNMNASICLVKTWTLM